MSEQGPRLLRTKGGYAYAKFNGRKINFGRHDDPDARPRFDAFKARWLLNGRELTDDMLPDRAVRRDAITVDQLAVMFLAHLRERYDADWQRCNYGRIEHSLKPMRSLYGPDPAESFTPKRLQSVRRHMIDGGKLSRREINRRVLEIRRCFKWAVAEELVPGDRAHALAAIEGLRPGEYGARETEKVRPVDREVVDATMPYLTKPLAGLVELMWWCGARPSELFDLRPMDVDRSGDVWVVRLAKHKTARRGKRRELFFGPEAQRILKPFLCRAKDRPMFSPAESTADMALAKRAARKTPLYPSHVARYERERAARPDRTDGTVYTSRTFNRAITRAIRIGNRARAEEGLMPIPHWHPYQLRHAAATRIKRDHGLEAVRVLLGHTSATMSAHYAEDDLEKARAVMEKAG